MAAAALGCAACATTSVIRREDPGEGVLASCRLEGNRLPGAGGLRLDLERSDTVERAGARYRVLFGSLGARELAVLPDAPLRLSLGPDSLLLLPADSTLQRRVVQAELLLSRLAYVVSRAEVLRLAEAERVGISARGPFGPVRATLSPGNLAALRRFVEQCASERPLRPPADSTEVGSPGPGRDEPGRSQP